MDKIVKISGEKTLDKPSQDFKQKVIGFLNIKNLKILGLIVIVLVVFLIFIGLNSTTSKTNTTTVKTSAYQTTMQYCEQLENKLMNVLSSIEGAGNVNVMISVNGSPELVIASNSDEKTSTTPSGTTTTSTSTPIIVNSNGESNALVLTENLPTVKGVIVVSSGASNVAIKLNILNAVSTLLDISTDKISIIKGI